MIQKLQHLEVEKMGQILCVKKVPFRKSSHNYIKHICLIRPGQERGPPGAMDRQRTMAGSKVTTYIIDIQ